MAGTRLAIHATFAVELLVLVAVSFWYAAHRPHDPSASAEPFLADRSGRTILSESVAPVPSPDDDVGLVEYATDCATAVASQINAMMGVESKSTAVPKRPRRPSAFVQELRQQIAEFSSVGDGEGDGIDARAGLFPPLKINLSVPQLESATTGKLFAEALERGLRRHTARKSSPAVLVRTTTTVGSKDLDSCEDFRPSAPASPGSNREVKFPEIILLVGCSGDSISDEGGGDVVVRTALPANEEGELRRHLEEDVARAVSRLLEPLSDTNGHRVGSVSVHLIDEDPASHVAEGGDGVTAKTHFDVLGRALASSATSTIGSFLQDLSFVYGGHIQHGATGATLGGTISTTDAIRLEATSSAYLALPKRSVKKLESDRDKTPTKSVSPEDLADVLFTSSRRRKKDTVDVEWVLFVPSRQNAPLTVRDDPGGGEGDSIVLSAPQKEREILNNASPNGISIVNLPRFTANDGVEKISLGYREEIEQSLMYLAGFLRAIHGLSPVASAPTDGSDSAERTSMQFGEGVPEGLSFWELEAIARSRYHSSLERAFSETDTLMALLHQHARTIALPTEVAHELNNATRLLRESIGLVEQGLPVVYATSLLHGALRHIQSVKSDHRFMELPYFGPDHYLAVFSPLILPLVLPTILGLIREVKRFRKLRSNDNKD